MYTYGQVHDRVQYFMYLLSSLAQVGGISDVLLIFSHDIYSVEINDMVRSIKFCKVLQVSKNVLTSPSEMISDFNYLYPQQIFYPYSIQTHEHVFPGDDANDCSPGVDESACVASNVPMDLFILVVSFLTILMTSLIYSC